MDTKTKIILGILGIILTPLFLFLGFLLLYFSICFMNGFMDGLAGI